MSRHSRSRTERPRRSVSPAGIPDRTGNVAVMTCPACGAPTAAGARFCQECGQRLVASPEERRRVTILMADLVGFTTISADADPEQVKRLVDHCFERFVADIGAFGGRLDKIVGDELVALFGAPVAHEDDAERAVRAALRMQETLGEVATEIQTPVQVRIGINTGEVLVGAMRAGGDATAMGDVVNTAQRLQKLGAPGDVIVGAATELATRDAIRYEPLGPVLLRGREEPVVAFRAVDALAPPGRRRTRRRTPLVGRDAELGTLRGLTHMATKRERAHLVLLVGDAGVGKSRLASELGESAQREARRVRPDRRVPPLRRPEPLRPDRRSAAPGLGGRSVGRRRRPQDARSPRRPRTCSAPTPTPPSSNGSPRGCTTSSKAPPARASIPDRARDEALRAAMAVLDALALKMPLVLVLSDLHWASDDTLELCERLLGRLRDRPFVLIATARPDIEARWNPEPGKYNGITLQLDPLDHAATAELVRTLFDGNADPELATLLMERSGGNPFFIEELARLHAGLGRHPAAGGPGDAARAARSAARHTRGGRTHAARRLRGARRDRTDRGRCSNSPTVTTRARSRAARRARPHRARRRRFPFQVRPHPRDRLRHAHQGRTGPAPRACRTGTRRARRVGHRCGRAPSRDRRRARRRVGCGARRARRRARAGGRDARRALADRAERVESWTIFGDHNDRALGLLPPEPSRGSLACAARTRPGGRPPTQDRRGA